MFLKLLKYISRHVQYGPNAENSIMLKEKKKGLPLSHIHLLTLFLVHIRSLTQTHTHIKRPQP